MKKLKKLYTFLSSMKTGLILMGTTLLVLIAGSVLLPETFSKGIAFIILVVLMGLNMLLCTISQVRLFVKRFQKGVKVGIKQRIRQGGVLILHIGLVVLLIGAGLNTFCGERTTAELFEGETDVMAGIRYSQYALALDDFWIEYNDDGSASQYYAEIRVLAGDTTAAAETISVNDPLTVNGVKVYLSQYVDGIRVEAYTPGGWYAKEILGENQTFYFTELNKSLTIVRYEPDYHTGPDAVHSSVRPDNPHVLYRMQGPGETEELMVVPLAEWVKADEDTYFSFTEALPYVGFIVKTDPGLQLALIGGLMLCVGGCCLLLMKEKET